MPQFLTITNGKLPSVALFNRLNGEFVSVRQGTLADADFNETYYIGRDVEFDFTEQGDTIEGNLIIDGDKVTDNFKVVSYADRAEVIYEAQMNALAASKITDKYPLTDQINLLAKLVMKIGEASGLSESAEYEELNEMVEYIGHCIKVNQTKKEFYKNDPATKYISDQDQIDSATRRYEGGIAEEIGAKPVTGGNVFS